ncbi:hypothetical protein D918_02784 [Trichuris suis]|nr:hypothetical protein D918_02784 [Trichuris suis]
MKMKPYWILPLLFVLLAASKDSSEDRSSSKERDRLVEGLMSKVEDLLPPPPSTACVNRSTEWSPEKKGKAAKNIFNTLLIGLPNPSEFTFEKLIAGAKCGGSDQAQIILHMKVKRTVVVKTAPWLTLLKSVTLRQWLAAVETVGVCNNSEKEGNWKAIRQQIPSVSAEDK